MQKLFLGLAFLISVVSLPWFVSVLVSIAYLSVGGSVTLVVVGGFILDELFGAPIPALHGFAYLYTFLMLALALITLYLRQMLFE